MQGYASITQKIAGVVAAGALAVAGYDQGKIMNAASEFQPSQSYRVQAQGYGEHATEGYQGAQGVAYQSSVAQQAAVPLDVRESMCPTGGHCPVCHRLCMMPK